jgi:hypothetical protein
VLGAGAGVGSGPAPNKVKQSLIYWPSPPRCCRKVSSSLMSAAVGRLVIVVVPHNFPFLGHFACALAEWYLPKVDLRPLGPKLAEVAALFDSIVRSLRPHSLTGTSNINHCTVEPRDP